MIAVRRADSDADLEAWIRVRRAILPNESGGTVDGLRAQCSPERLLLLAEVGGEVAGSGLADRSDLRDRFGLKPRELAAHAERFDVALAAAHLEEEDAGGFAERFGFRETDRQVEQVKRLGDEPWPEPPVGVDVVTVAERPGLLRDTYPLACEGYADLATEGPASISLDDWLRDEATLPGGSFVALSGGEIVGYSGLVEHDNEGVAEDGLTVVRRDWRRRGLAEALKRYELAWAAENGFREIVTWTQKGNDGMRRLNERLGYLYRSVSVTMVAPLPLPR
jgi:mycothiol synthase